MAKRALYQATERTIGAATDILHIGNSNKDYKITFANLCQYIWMYLTGTYFLQPAAKNISGGPQTTNLSAYEANSASEKPNGFRIKVSWTGGNKTYSHLFTGTTYTIGGLAIAKWAGYGTGELLLELDKTNGNWKCIGGINGGDEWDYFSTAAASGVIQIVTRKVTRKMKITISDENNRACTTLSILYTTSGDIAAINFAIAFSATPELTSMCIGRRASGSGWLLMLGDNNCTTSASAPVRPGKISSVTAVIECMHTYEGIEV